MAEINKVDYSVNTFISPITPSNPLKVEESNFYDLPTSPVTELMLNVMSTGKEDLPKLKDRKKAVSHNSEIKVSGAGQKRKVELLSPKEQITLTVSDIDKLTGSNKTAKKLFVFTMAKMAHKALSKGELYTDYIEFPVKELVDIGCYKDISNARRGFTAGMDILTSMKVGGTIQKNNKTEYTSEIAVLFPYASIKEGYCHVDFNKKINWNFVAQYYTKLPRYAFSLENNKAFDLLQYIFYLARQNTKNLKEQGFFTISFRALKSKLGLPDEDSPAGKKNPQRNIKDAIERAIEQVEDAHKNSFHNTDLQLLQVVNDELPIREWLNTGYLKVTMLGEYATPFIEIENKAQKKIETVTNQKARITEQARIKCLAEQMKEEKKASKEKEATQPQ